MLAGLKKAFTKVTQRWQIAACFDTVGVWLSLFSLFGRLLQEPSESVEQGAASSFTDNAISWEDLQRKVQQRQTELQWETPDLENVLVLAAFSCLLYS